MSEIFVVSIGGSLIVPDDIDTDFLSNLRDMVKRQVEKGNRFVLISGGGVTAREYQEAAGKVEKLHREDLDWLGIHATRLNAHLLRTIFRDEAKKRIVTDPTEAIDFTEDVLVASGWKPGHSTDYDAVLLANKLGSDKVLNLSNIDYVYDKNPYEHDDAKPFKELSWAEFLGLIPDKWDPGLSTPFDPVASRKAQESSLEVSILNGSDLDNVESYLEGEDFKGTVIK